MAEHWNGGSGGKGSRPRPYSVDQKTFENNWDTIFKKTPKEIEDAKIEDEAFADIERLSKLRDEQK